MEREEQETRQSGVTITPEEDDSREKGVVQEESVAPDTFQALRTLLEKARPNQHVAPSRRELSRDKSKSFLVLAGATIALLLIFLGVFSSPKTRVPLPGETARGAPSLGRKTTPGQQNDATKAVTPMLTADVRERDNGSGSQVTPQDVGGTSPRYNQFRQVTGNATGGFEKPPAGRPANSEAYALKNVDFSDPAVAQPASIPNPPRLPAGEPESELKKPSIVFVRAAQSTIPSFQRSPIEDGNLAGSPTRWHTTRSAT